MHVYKIRTCYKIHHNRRKCLKIVFFIINMLQCGISLMLTVFITVFSLLLCKINCTDYFFFIFFTAIKGTKYSFINSNTVKELFWRIWIFWRRRRSIIHYKVSNRKRLIMSYGNTKHQNYWSESNRNTIVSY